MIKHTINAAIQIVPKTKSDNHYDLIDKAIEVIKASGLRYSVTPMETVIEGGYDAIMKVIKEAQEATLAAGADELVVSIKFHIRKNGDVSFEEKTHKYQ